MQRHTVDKVKKWCNIPEKNLRNFSKLSKRQLCQIGCVHGFSTYCPEHQLNSYTQKIHKKKNDIY